MGRWSRFWRLEAHERRLLVAALLMLPLTRLALRVVGFRRWQSFLTRFVPHSSQAAPADAAARGAQTARMVRAAAREGLGRPNCLSRSLVLWWLLARQGFPAELRIGARKKKDDALEAHAWVELAGRVLGEDDDPHSRYAAFHQPVAAAPRSLGTRP